MLTLYDTLWIRPFETVAVSTRSVAAQATMRMPTTNPAPTRPQSSRATSMVVKSWANAVIRLGTAQNTSRPAYIRPGSEPVERHADEDAGRDRHGDVAQRQRAELARAQPEVAADRLGKRCKPEPDHEGVEWLSGNRAGGCHATIASYRLVGRTKIGIVWHGRDAIGIRRDATCRVADRAAFSPSHRELGRGDGRAC